MVLDRATIIKSAENTINTLKLNDKSIIDKICNLGSFLPSPKVQKIGDEFSNKRYDHSIKCYDIRSNLQKEIDLVKKTSGEREIFRLKHMIIIAKEKFEEERKAFETISNNLNTELDKVLSDDLIFVEAKPLGNGIFSN